MNTKTYDELLPSITPENEPFWDGCANGELRLQLCESCGTYRFPDSEVCPRCLSVSFSWRPVSGKGTLWSWIIMHKKYYKAFEDYLPYLVAYIKLVEGPSIISTLSDVPDGLRIDQPVRAVFEPSPSGRHILKFTIET